MKTIGTQIGLLILLILLVSGVDAQRDELSDKFQIKIKHKELKEPSGLASASAVGQFWTLNDSGNKSQLFRFDLQGDVIQSVTLPDLKNEDWEAIKSDDDGNVIICDVGDNDEKRILYSLHRIPETDLHADEVNRSQTYIFRYSDNQSHNCEAVFTLNGNFYLITKEKKKKERPSIFKLSDLRENFTNMAVYLGEMPVQGEITDSFYSSKHGLLAVLAYDNLFFFPVQKDADLFDPPSHTIPIDFGKCEAICFDDNAIVIMNEKSQLWRYPLDYLKNLEL